jgi:predicted amidohydrolase YtcJ
MFDMQTKSTFEAVDKLNVRSARRLPNGTQVSLDAAYAAHMEDAVGSLEPGKWADFVLLDRDYFTVDENEIDDIEVIATYVARERP